MKLSPEQIQSYKENGFLVIDGFLSAKACDELIAEADDAAQGHYTNILNLHVRKEGFFKLLTSPDVLSMADDIQGARMIPIGSIFFFCKPENVLEQGSHMHQDNYAAKAPYGSYFVCGVAFDDTDESNGALIVYPGSHKLGDLESTPKKNFDFDQSGKIVKAYPIGNEVKIPEGSKPVQLKYSRGSIIFIHGHIVHGAPPNPSKTKWRRKIYLHYIKDGDPFWPGWNARRQIIDRNATFDSVRALQPA
jgi:ectoine hydroxylase-related dioxygenase (phytanoyl-CoA dioxygenase family)